MKPIAIASFAFIAACGGSTQNIAGTEIPRTAANEELIDRVEEYRLAVERKDSAALLLMASQEYYWEDSGTPSGEDDYGFDGLRDVLSSRFQQAESIRYAVRYMKVKHRGCEDMDSRPAEGQQRCRAYVDLLVDASFTIPDARGELKRHDKRDQNQLVLDWDGEKWLFISGM